MPDSLAHAPWAVFLIAVPLGGALLCFLFPRGAHVSGLVTAALALLGAVGLAGQVAVLGPQRHDIGGWGTPLGIGLHADGLSAVMLALTGLVGFATSVYAAGYFKRPTDSDHAHQSSLFWTLWLFLWSALNVLALSADAFNVYVALELLGLAAVALVALAGTAQALDGAMRYLLVSLLGSLSYLLGVALLYATYGSLDLASLAQAMEPAPPVWVAMGLMTAGLLLKTALFPLHFWLPPAHASAPAPVSAALSALVVKASFYLILRLWFDVFDVAVTRSLAQFLGILGAAAVVWGSVQALLARRLKLLVAYSTVAQLGYLFLVFPLALAPPVAFTAWSGTVTLLFAHGCAKAAMFFAAGNVLKAAGHDRIDDLKGIGQALPVSFFAMAVAGISLVGLPPSGGFTAKWMLTNAALVSGQWWWVALLVLGSLLAAGYVFRILSHAFMQATPATKIAPVGVSMEWSALALAIAALVLGLAAAHFLNLAAVGAPVAGAALLEISP